MVLPSARPVLLTLSGLFFWPRRFLSPSAPFPASRLIRVTGKLNRSCAPYRLLPPKFGRLPPLHVYVPILASLRAVVSLWSPSFAGPHASRRGGSCLAIRNRGAIGRRTPHHLLLRNFFHSASGSATGAAEERGGHRSPHPGSRSRTPASPASGGASHPPFPEPTPARGCDGGPVPLKPARRQPPPVAWSGWAPSPPSLLPLPLPWLLPRAVRPHCTGAEEEAQPPAAAVAAAFGPCAHLKGFSRRASGR